MKKITKIKRSTSQINIMTALGELLADIGWAVAIPDQNSVDHLVIGKKEVIKKVTDELEKKYDIMTKDN